MKCIRVPCAWSFLFCFLDSTASTFEEVSCVPIRQSAGPREWKSVWSEYTHVSLDSFGTLNQILNQTHVVYPFFFAVKGGGTTLRFSKREPKAQLYQHELHMTAHFCIPAPNNQISATVVIVRLHILRLNSFKITVTGTIVYFLLHSPFNICSVLWTMTCSILNT